MIIFAWFVRQSDLELDHVLAPDLHFGDVISAIARETDISYALQTFCGRCMRSELNLMHTLVVFTDDCHYTDRFI